MRCSSARLSVKVPLLNGWKIAYKDQGDLGELLVAWSKRCLGVAAVTNFLHRVLDEVDPLLQHVDFPLGAGDGRHTSLGRSL